MSQYSFILVGMRINYRLLLIFYRPLFILNFTLSLFSVYFISVNGWRNQNIDINNAVVTTVLKFAGYAVSVGYQYTMLRHIYFYYRNAGIRVRKMYAQVLMLDLLIYITMLSLCNLII